MQYHHSSFQLRTSIEPIILHFIFNLSIIITSTILTPKMSGRVDVSGIDKVLLLSSLWARAKVVVCRSFDEQDAEAGFVQDGHFDCFCGRFLKCNLKGKKVDPWLYDHENGEGLFQWVVAEIREVYNNPPVHHMTTEGASGEAATDASSN